MKAWKPRPVTQSFVKRCEMCDHMERASESERRERREKREILLGGKKVKSADGSDSLVSVFLFKGFRMILNIKLGIMDMTDGEREQRVKTADRQHRSVLVLSEMEESERMGRVCRALKYQPKLLPRSNNSEERSDGQHVCRTCGEGHTCRADLKLHMKKHNNRSTGYRLRSGLDESKKKPDYEGEEQTSLDQSLNNEPEFSQSKKHVCNLCGMEYVRKPNLVSHMRIHTGETPYTCKVCGKGFRRSDWLLKHMNIHKEASQKKRSKKRYPCDHCEKVYTCKTFFQSHLRTHTGERPYSCAICQSRFHNKSCLRKHLVCHSDARPYTCSECGHGFKRVGTLNKHKRIHTGEKPYSCSFCGKTFPYKFSLSTHINSSRCKRSRAAKIT